MIRELGDYLLRDALPAALKWAARKLERREAPRPRAAGTSMPVAEAPPVVSDEARAMLAEERPKRDTLPSPAPLEGSLAWRIEQERRLR